MAKNYKHRTDLAGEHQLTDIGQLIGLLVFLPVWIMDSFVFNYTTFLSVYIPLLIRLPLAALFMLLALWMAIVSHRIIFKEVRTPPEVITKGFFKFVRHPLYLSEIIVYLGLFLFSLSLASLLIIIIFFIFLNYVALVEEKKLEAVFGNAYLAYKQRTGKWFPKFHGKKTSAVKA